jgi:hypothetical protein
MSERRGGRKKRREDAANTLVSQDSLQPANDQAKTRAAWPAKVVEGFGGLDGAGTGHMRNLIEGKWVITSTSPGLSHRSTRTSCFKLVVLC